jgi:DNA-binding HxlR family transcriptional regulator
MRRGSETDGEPRVLRPAPAPSQPPTDWEMVHGTRLVVRMLAGRWSVGVLYLLADGTKRFSELFYEVGEVSKKALTHTLRSLERDGLVQRRAYAEVPTRVEYSLTPVGWSITTVLMGMYEWAAQNESHVASARLRTRTHGSAVAAEAQVSPRRQRRSSRLAA